MNNVPRKSQHANPYPEPQNEGVLRVPLLLVREHGTIAGSSGRGGVNARPLLLLTDYVTFFYKAASEGREVSPLPRAV